MTPWQTPEKERARKNPLAKAICPLLPRYSDLYIFKPFFADLTWSSVYALHFMIWAHTYEQQTAALIVFIF